MGTTTTPFDMVARNDLDRYRLVMDVIDRVPGLAVRRRRTTGDGRSRTRHQAWIRERGTDLPEVADWTWNA
jgi:xylulose-5-phosphate/fructose-6-phosphate phosphoketolase